MPDRPLLPAALLLLLALAPARAQPPTTAPSPTTLIDASKPTGGFFAEPVSPELLTLHWLPAPGRHPLYSVFRSTQPRFKLDLNTLLTPNANPPWSDNHKTLTWDDNQADRNTRYYYAIVEVDTGVIATGSAATPAEDQPPEPAPTVAPPAIRPDQSTPIGTLAKLSQAIDRADIDATAACLALPPEPSPEARRADAEQLIWAARLRWWMDAKFDNNPVVDLSSEAGLRYAPHYTPADLQQLAALPPDQQANRLSSLTRTGETWTYAADYVTVGSPLVGDPAAQSHRIATLRAIVQACESHHIGSLEEIRDALARSAANSPATTQPAGTIGAWAQQESDLRRAVLDTEDAIDRADFAAVLNRMHFDRSQDEQTRHFEADYLITRRQLATAVRAQFSRPRADRLIRHVLSLQDTTWDPAHQPLWNLHGDLADKTSTDANTDVLPWNLMRRVYGAWKIDAARQPPSWRWRTRGDMFLAMDKQLIPKLKDCHTVADVRAARLAGSPLAALAGGADDRFRKNARQWLTRLQAEENAPTPEGGDATSARVRWTYDRLRQLRTLGRIDDAAQLYYVANDPDHAYAKARVRRAIAAQRFQSATADEFCTPNNIAEQLGILTPLDDLLLPTDLDWKIDGDTAAAEIDTDPLTHRPPATVHMKHVGHRWLIDATTPAGADPVAGARLLDQETAQIESLTRQIKDGKFDDFPELKSALTKADLLPDAEH